MRVDFHASPRPTLGIEWELALVDADTGDLVPAAEQVMSGVEIDRQRVHHELLLNTVELVTGVCDTVADGVADLAQSLAAVTRAAKPYGVELFCAGTHPFARPEAQRVTDGERYATLIDRTQWWGRQMLIYGLHVHVGVDSVHKVMPILSGLLTYAPHLQALSASSPFWGGTDTGYASNRALMFQQLPTAGLPFQFEDWAGYEKYVGDVFTTGVVDELKEIRWDVRPSPSLGTLETRVCDGPPTLQEVAALAALTHCLVVDLSDRLEAGQQPDVLPPWHVQENKWRAARYGMEAIVIADSRSRELLVADDLAVLLERLTPVARRLDCVDELSSVEDIVRLGASYQRQRTVAAAAGGDLRAVVRSLVGELREGLPVG